MIILYIWTLDMIILYITGPTHDYPVNQGPLHMIILYIRGPRHDYPVYLDPRHDYPVYQGP